MSGSIFFFLQEYVNKLKPVLSKEAKVKLSKKMYKKKTCSRIRRCWSHSHVGVHESFMETKESYCAQCRAWASSHVPDVQAGGRAPSPSPTRSEPRAQRTERQQARDAVHFVQDVHVSLSVGSDTKLPGGFLAEVLREIENFKKKCKKMKEFAGKSAYSLTEELDRALKGSLKENISKTYDADYLQIWLCLLQKLRGHVSFSRVIDDLA